MSSASAATSFLVVFTTLVFASGTSAAGNPQRSLALRAVLARYPNRPLNVAGLRFAQDQVVGERGWATVHTVWYYANRLSRVTALARLKLALSDDPIFSPALTYSHPDNRDLHWQKLADSLLQPDTKKELLLTKLALGKIDFIRDYLGVHRLAMIRMSEILESDPEIRDIEQALFEAGQDTLMMRIYFGRYKPLEPIITAFLLGEDDD